MSMKKFVFAGLLGVAAMFGTGCSDACESAGNRYTDRLEECGVEVEEGDEEEGEEVECTDALADAAEKIADCAEAATCEKVKDGTFLADCD